MSNSVVGTLYAKIVEDVISNCRAPFEEEGAMPNVLDDFKKEWQKKISLRKVAQMPWDPAPTPATQNPNAVPPTRPQPYAAPASATQNGSETKIKTEPNTSYDLQNLSASQPASYTTSNAPLAMANARQELRETFGDQANASIKSIDERAQGASNGSHGQKRPLPAGSPTQESSDSKRLMTDYNSGLQTQAQVKLEQLGAGKQRTPAVGAAQTDGAADWKAMIAERMSMAAEDVQAADQSIMDLVRGQLQTEDDNGLMMPISNVAKKSSKSKKTKPLLRAQFDGVDDDEADLRDDDDEEADADAINSDLDDDDEEQVDDDDDEDPQQLIVCTYEKVQRVKSKWKCTLRDGILITGGQEYIFSKATGEFEW